MNGLGSFWVNTISCTGVFVKVKCYVYIATSIHVLLYCFCMFILFYLYVYLIFNVLYWVDRRHINNGATCLVMEPVTHLPPSTYFVGWWRRDSKAPRLLHGQFQIIKHDFKYIHVHFSDVFNKIMVFYCSVIFHTSFQRNAGHSYQVTISIPCFRRSQLTYYTSCSRETRWSINQPLRAKTLTLTSVTPQNW